MKRNEIKGFRLKLSKKYSIYFCYYKNIFNILSITFDKNYTTLKYLYDKNSNKEMDYNE